MTVMIEHLRDGVTLTRSISATAGLISQHATVDRAGLGMACGSQLGQSAFNAGGLGKRTCAFQSLGNSRAPISSDNAT